MTWRVVPGASSPQGLRSTIPQALPKDSKPHGKLARVLIVDDEPSICKALSMALSSANYDVIAAQSGESALAIIRNENVDVMVIDLRIPDMRGDVIFEVAAVHQPHLPLSDALHHRRHHVERAHKLITACKCHFLRKPFDLRDLRPTRSPRWPRASRTRPADPPRSEKLCRISRAWRPTPRLSTWPASLAFPRAPTAARSASSRRANSRTSRSRA